MSNAATSKLFVEEVLQLQERMENALKQSFFAQVSVQCLLYKAENPLFLSILMNYLPYFMYLFIQESFRVAMQRSFEHFLNTKTAAQQSAQSAQFPAAPSVLASELLAKFLDRKLRGEKGVSDSDTEALLDKVRSRACYLCCAILF